MDFDDVPDEEWIDDEGDPEDDVLACPSCRQSVHEDTQQCPHCGDWIIPVDPSERFRKLLWAAVALLLVGSLILWVVV